VPKNQSTAAQRARQRQAATGEKYTTALRAEAPGPVRFRPYSARGAGWVPILRQAEQEIAVAWPDGPLPHWEEKFGDLCWKRIVRGPEAVWRIVGEAATQAARTCQTCPSPGRKRVVWDWQPQYGWVMPWVKTCCDACYYVPQHLKDDPDYLDLVDEYEEPIDTRAGCCTAIDGLALLVRAEFERGGLAALLAKLAELHQTLWSRSPHWDVFSGHAVLLAVEEACTPLMYRVRQEGIWSDPVLAVDERRQVVQVMEGMYKLLSTMEAEELRD
jgi:hypothetical protein